HHLPPPVRGACRPGRGTQIVPSGRRVRPDLFALLRAADVPGRAHRAAVPHQQMGGERPELRLCRGVRRLRGDHPDGAGETRVNYRHAFHAGNFADVMKHIILVRLIEYLKLKPAAFRVIDTHAGTGRYSLTGDEARRSPEWMEGIGKLLQTG